MQSPFQRGRSEHLADRGNYFPEISDTVVDVARSTLCPTFSRTRVPIQNLIDYLEGGDSIEDFLVGFPSVSREQVIAFLEEAKARMLAPAAE